MKTKLQGIVPALVTPFSKDGTKVEFEKAQAVAMHLVKQGVHGLFVAGTTGEGPLMSVAERKQLLESVIDAVGKKVMVIANTGTFDTPSTIELCRHAQEAGAVACGVASPAFYTFDRASLLGHYVAVAKSVPSFPVMLYNIPGCTHNPLELDLILEIAKTCSNISGIKDSSGRFQNMSALLANRPKDFRVFNGVDEYAMQAVITGADGIVASTANVLPKLFIKIYEAAKKGNIKEAWKHQQVLNEACGMFQYGKMVAFYKEGLRLQGVDPGFVRAPQRQLTKEEAKGLAKGLKKLGLI